MIRVSAAEAENSLGSLLAKVQAGETILITSQGKPVATVSPVDMSVLRSDRNRIAQLALDGVVSLPRQTLDLEDVFSKEVPKLPAGVTAVGLIDLERDGR